MNSAFLKLLHLLLAVITLAISAVILWGLWNIAVFFEAELVHNELMAVGDSRDLNIFERIQIKFVWIPFGIVLVLTFLFHAYLVKSYFKNMALYSK